MRGYPKHIATKQDFKNLLGMSEFKERALTDLKRLQANAVKEAKVIQVISGSEEKKNLITREIDNPSPKWAQMGFKSKKELDDLVTAKEVPIYDK